MRVYPRGGGGTLSSEARAWRRLSRSIPAGAGEPAHVDADADRRSIPAGAGVPLVPPLAPHYATVYPRGGGGTICIDLAIPWRLCEVYPRGGGGTGLSAQVDESPGEGLSPRGRGNHPGILNTRGQNRVYPRGGGGTYPPCGPSRVSDVGSIPAGAGEPHRSKAVMTEGREAGSIPAGAGEPQTAPDRRTLTHWGSIPAGAGEPMPEQLSLAVVEGSIPAGAGEPFADTSFKSMTQFGLSPRGRGNPNLARHVYPRGGGGTTGATGNEGR